MEIPQPFKELDITTLYGGKWESFFGREERGKGPHKWGLLGEFFRGS